MADLEQRSRAMAEILLPFAVPLMIFPSRSSRPEEMIGAGSGALVDTGCRKLIVTCDHVWRAYEVAKGANPETVIIAGRGNARQPVVVGDFPVLARHRELDLLAVEFVEPGLLANCTKTFYRAQRWPPVPPDPGDVVCAIGFPGLHNLISHGGCARTLHADTIVDFVVSVSDRNIVMADTQGVRTQTFYQPGLAPLGSLGGLSGSPVFVNRDGTFDFVGIIYEAGENTGATLFISHAHYLQADGSLDNSRMPWLGGA